MGYEQLPKGRYNYILADTPNARREIGDLISWLVELKDFSYFNQTKRRLLGDTVFLAFNRNDLYSVDDSTFIRVHLFGDSKGTLGEGVMDPGTLPYMLEDHWHRGYDDVEVGFRGDNPVEAIPRTLLERWLGGRKDRGSPFTKLCVRREGRRIHVYTNGEDISSHVANFKSVVTKN